jgi:hypothetical protein
VGEYKMKKRGIIFCFSMASILASVMILRAGCLTVYATSTADTNSLALQFLRHVAGFDMNGYQMMLLKASNGDVEATVSNGYGESDADVTFIDGNLWRYSLHSLYGNLGRDEQGFNDSLNTLIKALNEYQALFNASYCGDFAQLVSTALQTQKLSAENENFSLEIDNGSALWAICYAKIDGQYTSLFRSMQVRISTGLVTAVNDCMRTYHVATTNVAVSREQAIAISEPYVRAFAQKNHQNTIAINATLEYERDYPPQRGDRYALYPTWYVYSTYDKPGEGNATSYSVGIWADNGEIFSNGPIEPALAAAFSQSNTNVPVNLPLLLVPPVIIFALASGVYLHRKKTKRK